MTDSIDLKRKVFLIREREQFSFEAIAKRFEIGKSNVSWWSKPIKGSQTGNQPATKIDMEALKQDVEEYPDTYLYERAQRLGVSRRGIGDALKRLGISRKNKRSLIRKPMDRHGAIFKKR